MVVVTAAVICWKTYGSWYVDATLVHSTPLHPPKDCWIPSTPLVAMALCGSILLQQHIYPSTPGKNKTKHLLVWQKKHVFVCVNGWMRLECKAVWVVSGTRKALNKCSPLSIFPASKFPKSWSDWDAYPASKQIKQTPNTTGHSQRPKWYLWHNIRLVVLLLWLIGAIYVKIKTLQTAVHV